MSLSLRTLFVAGVLEIAAVAVHAQTAPAVQPAPVSATPPVAAPAAPMATPATGLLLAPALVPGNFKVYLAQRYAADKEARAAIHMFGRKQTGGAIWLVGGGAFLGFLISQTGTTTDGTGTRTFTISPLGYLVFGGLPAAIAIGKFARFNSGELYKMLLEYDKTHALPGNVVAKLGKSDYQ